MPRAGQGFPTDRPDAIARSFVEQGAPVIHLVDLDGAHEGRPVNLEVIASVARAVATPLQVAGGIDGPDQIEIAFAAGATRVVMPMWSVVEDPDVLSASLRIAGDWLAIGLDAREERLAEYPWRHRRPPTLSGLVSELAGAGVRRFVLSHGGASPDLELHPEARLERRSWDRRGRRGRPGLHADRSPAGWGRGRDPRGGALRRPPRPTGCGRCGSPDALVTARFV